jgi:hypothetical protein
MSAALPTLTERLILAASDFLQADSLESPNMATLLGAGAYVLRLRDEDDAITPRDDETKAPRVIIHAEDTGRTVKSAPIRNMRLEFRVRANAKVPAALTQQYSAITSALERLLDTVNLSAGLDSQSARLIRVFLATRQPGVSRQVKGLLLTMTWALDIRAVGMEHTTS